MGIQKLPTSRNASTESCSKMEDELSYGGHYFTDYPSASLQFSSKAIFKQIILEEDTAIKTNNIRLVDDTVTTNKFDRSLESENHNQLDNL